MPSFEEIIAALKESSTAYKDKLAKAYASPEAFKQAFMSNLAELAPPDPRDKEATMQFAINRAMDIPGGFAGAIKAYHGSPHKFDAFDMSKIGTGEGAQAYGHGLYFAESPEVANQYAQTLSKNGAFDSVPQYEIQNGIMGPEYMINEVRKNTILAGNNQRSDRFLDNEFLTADDAVKWLTENKKIPEGALIEKVGDPGYETTIAYGHAPQLYNVSLEWPDAVREATDPLGPQHFLDWDKPLSEQEGIQRALLKQDDDFHKYASQLNPKMRELAEDMVMGKKPVFDETAGQQWAALYEAHPNLDHNEIHDTRWRLNKTQDQSDWLFGVMNGNAAIGSGVKGGGGADLYDSFGGGVDSANRLKELGIPGIRYLDGGSRGAGEGSYNYVIFDDKIPRIVERNGKGLLGEPK